MLEACCGTGALALALRQRGVEVYALDLAPRMLAQAARFAQAGLSPARLVQGDVTRLPFPDRAFDHVLVTSALGLLPRPLLEATFGLGEAWAKTFQKLGGVPLPVWFQSLSGSDDFAMVAVMSAADASAGSGGGDALGGGSSGAG